MSSIDDKLNEVLNITPEIIESSEISTTEETQITVPIDKDAEVDFDTGRENLYKMLEKGNNAIDGILALAKEGEHPRAYEVAGQLIKTVADVSKDLMAMQEKLKKLKDERRVSASLKSSVTDTRIKKIQNRKRSLKRRKLKDVRRVLVILKSSTRLKQSQKVRRSLLSKYISVVGLVSSSLVRNARRSHKSKIRKIILLSKKLKTLKFKHSIRKYSYRDRLRRLKPSQEARKTKHITSKTSQRIRKRQL